jgi:4-hydroxybenzoate polyprenyltransferase
MKPSSFNKKIFDFIVFSNLFIALCAVLMVWQTWNLFSGQNAPFHFLAFIFFATLSSYSIHWYLTDENIELTASRTFWLSTHKNIHIALFIISAIGCSYFLLDEMQYLKWILPAMILTMLYSAPKIPLRPFKNLQKYIWGKTVLLAIMWTYVTVILPLQILQVTWQQYVLFGINRFALIFPVCILFDIRDKEHDKKTGIKSIVTKFSLSKIKIIYALATSIGIMTSFLHLFTNQKMMDSIFLAIPSLATIFLTPKSFKTKSDYYFYFLIDGLMASSAIFFLIHFITEKYFLA